IPATAPPSSALATSYQPRPASTTPVERATSSASWLEVSYSAPPVQDMSCPGPAMNPSSDIATCRRTMVWEVSAQERGDSICGRCNELRVVVEVDLAL